VERDGECLRPQNAPFPHRIAESEWPKCTMDLESGELGRRTDKIMQALPGLKLSATYPSQVYLLQVWINVHCPPSWSRDFRRARMASLIDEGSKGVAG
jgi:hypothetical protein